VKPLSVENSGASRLREEFISDKEVVKIKVPTGDIIIVSGENDRKLEVLSLGDYGAEVNLNQHQAVEHRNVMPLTDKWVITMSTQYGCSMGCEFCDVPKVGPGKNVTEFDLYWQFYVARQTHPEIEDLATCKRINVHFARMGEPTWNQEVISFTKDVLYKLHEQGVPIHPVVSTMMPVANVEIANFLDDWLLIKNRLFNGEAGLQLSINSTDDMERDIMFNGNSMLLYDIAETMNLLVDARGLKGRKITLNFAVAGYKVDPYLLRTYGFDPMRYIVKLTPMHKTSTAIENSVTTAGDYTSPEPYEELEEEFKKAGYETLVFIASREEDLGRITCGNAILSGSKPEVEYTIEEME
jgi:23S rRNA (adenine2503-C2)-methyltransferase